MRTSWTSTTKGAFIISLLTARTKSGCISLRSSKSCSAFDNDFFEQNLTEYTFLSGVQHVAHFDTALDDYVEHEFPRLKFQGQFGCTIFNSTTSFYARYTTTILCASIVQLSQSSCGHLARSSRTACAGTCAEYARSEVAIATSAACGLDFDNKLLSKVKEDYNLCSTPNSAYGTSCVEGLANEPQRCGYGTNTEQLCSYCKSRTINNTDICCQTIGNETCDGLMLHPVPPVVILQNPESTAGQKLSQGVVIAIVLCSCFALVVLMIIIAIFYWKRRRLASLRNRLATLHLSPVPAPVPAVRPMQQFLEVPKDQSILTPPILRTTRTMSAYQDRQRDSTGTSTSRTTSSSPHPQPYRTLDSDDDERYLAGSPPFSRQDFYALGVAINRSEASLSSSRLSRPLSFTDQYSGQKINVGAIVRCVCDYDPTLPDEISCKHGDFIKVTKVYDDRWCKGLVLAPDESETPGPTGAFPIVCVCARDHDIPAGAATITGSAAAVTIQPSLSSDTSQSGASARVYANDLRSMSDRELQAPLLPVVEEDKAEGQSQPQMEVTNKPSFSRFREHVDRKV